MARWIALAVVLLSGCGGPTEKGPTWNADVGPLLRERCVACHQDGGVGGFALDTYAAAKPIASMIYDAVADGRMPPYDAEDTEECGQLVPFKDDPRFTEDEIALVERWIDKGKPKGEEQETKRKSLEPEHLQDPDAVVKLEQPFTVPGSGPDVYQCFRVEVPRDAGDVWITGVEVFPDNSEIVHHVLVWSDPFDLSAERVDGNGTYPCSGEPDIWPTELIGGWTPGSPPTQNPPGTGTLFKPGATVVINVHYHATAEDSVDQTEVAIKWTRSKPNLYTTYYMVDIPFGGQIQPGPNDIDGPEFRIPAGVPDHVETHITPTDGYLPWSVPVFSIMPHMHYLGTELKASIQRDDGSEECLVHAPRYRFDFQNAYYYDGQVAEMPEVEPGDDLVVRCTYDNSPSNPRLGDALEASGADEPIDVYWGEETGDEMCMAIMGFIIPPVDLTELL